MKIICDNCGEHMESTVVHLEFMYGSEQDGEHLRFCSDECLYIWTEKKYNDKKLTSIKMTLPIKEVIKGLQKKKLKIIKK